MIEHTYRSWMSSLRGLSMEHITLGHALELAVGDQEEINRLTALRSRGIVFLDIKGVLAEERRSRPRREGRFKQAEDVAYQAIRKLKEKECR